MPAFTRQQLDCQWLKASRKAWQRLGEGQGPRCSGTRKAGRQRRAHPASKTKFITDAQVVIMVARTEERAMLRS